MSQEISLLDPYYLRHPDRIPDPGPIDERYDEVRLHVEMYRAYAALDDEALRTKLSAASYKTVEALLASIGNLAGGGGALVGPDMDNPHGPHAPAARVLFIAYGLGRLGATFAEGDRMRGLLTTAASATFTAIR